MTDQQLNPTSNWPHRLALLLVCATFPLIWVGGLVTTTQAGMAVPDWPNTYGYNLFLYPISTWLSGPWDLFIEHGHRLLGALVGMITIGVAISLWRQDQRNWVRVFGLLALLAVIGQGVLGGMRVLLDERTLAKIHGCTGPAFFAMAVALAVVTSSWWREGSTSSVLRQAATPKLGGYTRLAMLTTLLAYVQLVLGAQVRHVAVGAAPMQFQIAVYFHLFMAVVLTLQIGLLVASLSRRKFRGEKSIFRPTLFLGGLIVLQIVLGLTTWVAKYAWPGSLADQAWTASYTITAGSMTQAVIITAHVATGSLIFVTALVLALKLGRFQYLENKQSSHALDTARENNSVSNRSLAIAAAAQAEVWQNGIWQAEGAL